MIVDVVNQGRNEISLFFERGLFVVCLVNSRAALLWNRRAHFNKFERPLHSLGLAVYNLSDVMVHVEKPGAL